MTKDFGEVDIKKGSLTMKTKLFVSILVLVSVVPGALAAGAEGETNVHTGSGQLLVTPVEDSASPNVQTDPGVLANDPKQASQDFDSILIAITEKFSGTLAAIADAIKRGELTTDQGREISAQQYQLVQMQFELVSLWRGMEEQDSANIPTLQASPDLTQENEAVVVALPFSSLQLNPSMAEYLGLTPSQIDAIQQVMVREQHRLEPLMSQDNGDSAFNTSEFLGALFASSLENSYYPRHDRTFADTMNRFGGALSSDAITDLLREFTPDMKRLFRRHAPKKIRRIEEKLPIPPEDKP